MHIALSPLEPQHCSGFSTCTPWARDRPETSGLIWTSLCDPLAYLLFGQCPGLLKTPGSALVTIQIARLGSYSPVGLSARSHPPDPADALSQVYTRRRRATPSIETFVFIQSSTSVFTPSWERALYVTLSVCSVGLSNRIGICSLS